MQTLLAVCLHRTFLIGIILLIGIAGSDRAVAAGPSQIKTVAVIGNGDIYRDSLAAARQAAINDSQVSAVKAVVSEMLSVDALVLHFPTLNQVLFEKTGQFVQDYKVLTEFKHGRKYRVLVQASVMMDRVVRELSSVGIVLEEQFLPKVLFFITEQNPKNTWPQYWWAGENASFLMTAAEQALSAAMIKNSFSVVDHGFLGPDTGVESIYGQSGPDDTMTAAIGARLGAEVVIVGISNSRDALNTKGESLKTYKGSVSLRAIRTDTGEEIARTDQTAIAAHADEAAGGRAAIAAAAGLAAADLSRRISGLWTKETDGPGVLEIKLTGTRDLVGFVKLRKIIAGLPGVDGIRVKEIRVNEATIAVAYQDDADTLAGDLILNDFESFGINIFDITMERIHIDIVPAAAGTEDGSAD